MSCLSLLFLIVGISGACSGFKICAFNVRNFDIAKSTNYRVMHTLTKVVSRCDICLLQEVKDVQGKVVKALVGSLNRYSIRYDDHYHYKSVASGGLGSKPNDTDQYVYLYRNETVEVKDKYQYADKKNAFSRDPFIVRFQAKATEIEDFALIPLHTVAIEATNEIDQLYDVFEEVKLKWKSTQVMFLGTLNAACGYMTGKDKANIRLFSNPGFYWLIGDKVDTTVRAISNCAYDRIVVHGQPFLKAIKPYSAKVFNIAKEYKLTVDKALEVSDHFPVEVELKIKSSGQIQAQFQPVLLIAITVVTYVLDILPFTSAV
ncbi:deoxyribonuclease gamma-like isoform X2 [Esox lucius]|uniref:Deoxyribonuclease n=1 Tax=Esox lucius TaxID=8010 RepID=A0AAY5JXJ5_ESOLU|nr:deoxyribonuclease gamma-like isoform X2 [Esox lucius]